MSWNRLRYDVGEQKKYVKETVGPGNYQVQTPIVCGTCFQENPSIIMQKGAVSMDGSYDWRFYSGPVDVESELRNITRPASRCPSNKYVPKCSNCGCLYQGQPCGAGVTALCQACQQGNLKPGQRCGDQKLVNFPDCYFPVEHTRLESCPPRSKGVNRFQPLCLDPQQNVMFPGTYQVPSRLVMKDNHRPCVPRPAVNSMDPPPRQQPCSRTEPVCANFTGPMYQYDVCG